MFQLGEQKQLVRWIAVAMTLFHIYTGIFGTLDAYMQRTIHLILGLSLTFLFIPFSKGKNKEQSGISLWADILPVVLAVLSLGYILANYNYLTVERFAMVSPLTAVQLILGIALVLLILEATRRVVGTSLLVVVICFIAYIFFGSYLPGVLHSNKYSLEQIIDFMYLGTGGIFGIPLGVSASDIAIFIIFGAFMLKAGIGNFLFDLGSAMVGNSSGGIGKVAVISSALMGMISGSGTANVVTSGSFTIPMMKKAGYPPHFAGAIEASASTGGQIMPPVMGATAFVIAAFTGLPYITICKYALIPAILYFASIYINLDLEAARLKLVSYKQDKKLSVTFKQYGHTLLPIALLVYLLIQGFSPGYSASFSILLLVIISQFRPKARMGIKDIIEAMERGAKGVIVVVTATAAAGIIVGALDLSSLGNRFTGTIMDLTQGNLLVGLILTMIISIILGMGMPTTPAYVLQVALVIPALISLGLPMYVAHFYAFYFSCLSLITPPVAITSYAAAGLAEADVWKTGWKAFSIALPAYIIPFAFAYSPTLLMEGSVIKIIIHFVTALLGVFAMCTALTGFWKRGLNTVWRMAGFAASLLLIAPLWQASLGGLILLAVIYVLAVKIPMRSTKQVQI